MFSTVHSAFKDESKAGHTRKGADVFEFGSEPHFGEEAVASGCDALSEEVRAVVATL